MPLLPQFDPWGPRANTRRATYLLIGGALAIHAVVVPIAAVAHLCAGRGGIGAVLLAFICVLLCSGVGQAVQVGLAESDPRTVMAGSLLSYAVRMGILGALLFVIRSRAVAWNLDKTWFLLALVLLTLAWLVGEILMYRWLRFPVYDTEYLPPSSEESRL